MELIETPIFSKQVEALLSPEEYRNLQLHLLLHPGAGAPIPGSGGLRKLRWGVAGRGKRGGARLIYLVRWSAGQLFLLCIYPKSVRSDLSRAELRMLRALIEDE